MKNNIYKFFIFITLTLQIHLSFAVELKLDDIKNKINDIKNSKEVVSGSPQFQMLSVLENITKSKVINQKNFLKDNFIICQRDIFIIDNLGIDKIIIKKLEYFNIHKIISFDDLNFTLSSGTIINGILFTKKILYPKKNINIYQGLKYFIMNSEYKKKRT